MGQCAAWPPVCHIAHAEAKATTHSYAPAASRNGCSCSSMLGGHMIGPVLNLQPANPQNQPGQTPKKPRQPACCCSCCVRESSRWHHPPRLVRGGCANRQQPIRQPPCRTCNTPLRSNPAMHSAAQHRAAAPTCAPCDAARPCARICEPLPRQQAAASHPCPPPLPRSGVRCCRPRHASGSQTLPTPHSAEGSSSSSSRQTQDSRKPGAGQPQSAGKGASRG